MASATQNLKAKPKDPIIKAPYSPTGNEQKVFRQFRDRKEELLQSRRNIGGVNIDEQMRRYDRDYFNRDARIPASELDTDQRPISINKAFGKLQSALAILVEGNPEIVLDEDNKKFRGNRELIKALAERSWDRTNSLGQFKLSVFNAAKRGWFAGRTYNRIIANNAKFPNSMDAQGRIQYESKLITHMDDIAYINLDNHNVWIDEQAKPEDFYATRDWMWREIWHIEDLRNTFPIEQFPNMAFVHQGGNTQPQLEGNTTNNASHEIAQSVTTKKGMTEVFFYENQKDDWFIIEINGVMVVWEPLPQSHKRLSLVTGLWNLRSAEDIYGIGIIEAMERDEELIDRILNMSMRQLLLSINPPGFYSGTEDFEDENIKLKAGVLRRTLNPKDITFVEVPPMGPEGLNTIGWLEQKEDQRTGITNAVESDATVTTNTDTAYELGLNKESALKRLKLPLKSFQYALNWEFQNRIALIQQTYSDFQVSHLADPSEIQDYLDEVGADPSFYYIENEGQAGQEVFFKKEFKEVALAIKQNDDGTFVPSDEKSFFKIKPEFLVWDGSVEVEMSSLMVRSEEQEKQQTLQLFNLLMPIFQFPPAIALNPVKQLLDAFDKDPKKWMPEAWLKVLEGDPNANPTINASDQGMIDGAQPTTSPASQIPTVVPPGQVGPNSTPVAAPVPTPPVASGQ